MLFIIPLYIGDLYSILFRVFIYFCPFKDLGTIPYSFIHYWSLFYVILCIYLCPHRGFHSSTDHFENVQSSYEEELPFMYFMYHRWTFVTCTCVYSNVYFNKTSHLRSSSASIPPFQRHVQCLRLESARSSLSWRVWVFWHQSQIQVGGKDQATAGKSLPTGTDLCCGWVATVWWQPAPTCSGTAAHYSSVQRNATSHLWLCAQLHHGEWLVFW